MLSICIFCILTTLWAPRMEIVNKKASFKVEFRCNVVFQVYGKLGTRIWEKDMCLIVSLWVFLKLYERLILLICYFILLSSLSYSLSLYLEWQLANTRKVIVSKGKETDILVLSSGIQILIIIEITELKIYIFIYLKF